jgi:cell division protein FtsW
MKARAGRIDRVLAILIAILVVGGCLIFASAAFGLLARGNVGISSVVFNHLVLGVGAGIVMLLITATVDYHFYQKYALYIFILALIGTALVFVPHLGSVHGGGRRWITLGPISGQPSEALKIAAIMIAAVYFSRIRAHINDMKLGLGGLCALLCGPVILLLLQPDIGTLGVICISTIAIFWTAGAKMRDIAVLFLVCVVTISLLAVMKPYVRDRIETFFHPSQGQQAEGYQIRQSLIAIGSGGLLGRGFGQGVQKFTYLPEPMGDSIFAVAGEELGFVGAILIIAFFLAFVLRGFAIAAHAPDFFGGLLAVGISTYLGAEAFINIGAMLGVTPLTGIPLTFISQGGTAMLISLASAGILLNISRQQRKKQ